MPEAAGARPGAGERVTLRLPCCGTRLHAARVHAVDVDTLVVTTPRTHPTAGAVRRPAAGASCVVGWHRGIEWMELPTTVTGDPGQWAPTWELAVAGPARPVERRSHVRVPEDRVVDLRVSDDAVTARILDLSEGGMRCAVHNHGSLEVGEEIHVRFNLENDLVDATARVVRAAADGTEVGLAFTSLGAPGAERIRHHVSAHCGDPR